MNQVKALKKNCRVHKEKLKTNNTKQTLKGKRSREWREVMGRNQVGREELSRLQHPAIQSKDSFPQDALLPPFHILACSSLSATNDF